MSTIVTRAGKGSALTWTEGDANITNLNNDKMEKSAPVLAGNLDVATYSIITSTTNGNIVIEPNGTGDVHLVTDALRVGDLNTEARISTYGTGNLVLTTNEGHDPDPSITIGNGANADITIAPTGTGSIILDGQNWPQADGTANQVLKTNGAGQLSWTTVSSGGIASVSADTAPSLGGNLNIGTYKIYNSSYFEMLDNNPNGTFDIKALGSHYLNFVSSSGTKLIFDGQYWPKTAGSANQYLKTDSMGNLSWATVSSGGITTVSEDTTPALGGNLNVAGNSIVSVSNGNITLAPNGTGKVIINGTLQVDGTTTTINSTTVTVDDPIITLGGDTAPSSDDNKDRGVEFRWHNGTSAKVGFFGYDDSTGYLTFIPDATNTSEVFSGTQGDIQATNFRGALIGNADTATTATNANNINISTITGNASDTTLYPVLVGSAATGNQLPHIDSGDLSFNGSTGVLTATGFSGSGASLTSIPNGALTNSSITFGSTATSLGGTVSALNSVSIGATTASTGAFTTLNASSTVTLSPASANVAISPTGTGTVAISPAGALTINPTTASTINNCSIGATTASTGRFTTITSTQATGTAPFTVASTTNVANLNASSLNGATFASPGAIGSTSASTGAFTTLSATSTVSGAGFSTYLASPPAIGGTTRAAGSFTTMTADTAVLDDIRETVFAGGTTTGTITPDAANGSVQTLTLTGNITLNAFANPVSGQTITLIITQSASGNNTLTSTMKFAGGSKTLSTAANAIDILTVSYIGTTYYASLSKAFA